TALPPVAATQRHGGHAGPRGRGREGLGKIGALEERERGLGVQLDEHLSNQGTGTRACTTPVPRRDSGPRTIVSAIRVVTTASHRRRPRTTARSADRGRAGRACRRRAPRPTRRAPTPLCPTTLPT